MICTTLRIVSAEPETGTAGTIRYTVSLNHPKSGPLTMTNIRSHSSVDDGSGIDRKAAAVGSIWPAFLLSNSLLQACIVEMEASEECEDEAGAT